MFNQLMKTRCVQLMKTTPALNPSFFPWYGSTKIRTPQIMSCQKNPVAVRKRPGKLVTLIEIIKRRTKKTYGAGSQAPQL